MVSQHGLGHRSREEGNDSPKWGKLKVGLDLNQDAGVIIPGYFGKVPGLLNDEKQ